MKKGLKVHLLIIDPQNDFMDILAQPGDPVGMELPDGTQFRSSLPVPGATEDMKRLANFINRIGGKLADIHVTLDSHQILDVAHPAWWVDGDGNNPDPFIIITADDVQNRIWTPRIPSLYPRMLDYVQKLEAGGKYPLCMWPPHCLIGTWGHNVQEDLNEVLQRWSAREFATVDYVTKGSNPFTEHYGALMAEVPDPDDPGTELNTDFLEVLAEADMVVVAGEALSHCVKETVQQIADNIGEDHIGKFHILTDCCSSVPAVPGGPDFPQIARDWLMEMEQRGMKPVNSLDFLA